ncbi:hypothetical protein Y1Q_0022884 [Alligator mississippiensis]|uniref:Uncharacterized protein n=1 Tax=Alligator mississippiensis TaxID=8496 RepID=A0A151N4V2_ALLMI|nr:hypothetical protein Y1Q_0022884 [Alligator mississippiensis]
MHFTAVLKFSQDKKPEKCQEACGRQQSQFVQGHWELRYSAWQGGFKETSKLDNRGRKGTGQQCLQDNWFLPACDSSRGVPFKRRCLQPSSETSSLA